MPITLSARKKARQDEKRQLTNSRILSSLKTALTKARKNPTPTTLKSAFSVIDQAAKKRVIHKNKATRLKSRLAQKTVTAKPTKKTRSRTKGKGV